MPAIVLMTLSSLAMTLVPSGILPTIWSCFSKASRLFSLRGAVDQKDFRVRPSQIGPHLEFPGKQLGHFLLRHFLGEVGSMDHDGDAVPGDLQGPKTGLFGPGHGDLYQYEESEEPEDLVLAISAAIAAYEGL